MIPFRSENYLGIISGSTEKTWGSFRGRDHFRVNLGIISGSGIISGLGSFRGLYVSCDFLSLKDSLKLLSLLRISFKVSRLKSLFCYFTVELIDPAA